MRLMLPSERLKMRIARNDKECLELVPECKEDISQFYRMVMARKLTIVFDENYTPSSLKIYKQDFPEEKK